jgi:DNA primase
MDVAELKTYIYTNGLAKDILSALGCTRIKSHSNYISAANPDGGDNPNAIILYLSEALICIDYTRNIVNANRTTDIFDLISYFKDCNFFQSLKWTCDALGLDYYSETQDVPESLQILKLLKSMSVGEDEEDNSPVKPISEKILDYYIDAGNVLFVDDGISLATQNEWEIKFDPQTNSVCIPIRDELGSLIAVKARRFKYTPNTPLEQRRFPDELGEDESKYFFLEPGAKSQVLYGLYKNAKAIQRQGIVYVGESEKFTLQLYDMGYYGVSTGGSKVSKRQVEMLTRLGVKICFCFDKDISEDDLRVIVEGFMDGVPVYAIIDRDNVLNAKQSPSDDICKWNYLIKNNIYKIKGGDSSG